MAVSVAHSPLLCAVYSQSWPIPKPNMTVAKTNSFPRFLVNIIHFHSFLIVCVRVVLVGYILRINFCRSLLAIVLQWEKLEFSLGSRKS